MKIDIIIATYRTENECTKQIDEIAENTHSVFDWNLIFTGLPGCAATNRNYGLDRATSDIIVMMDDDITGFYKGWLEDLIHPFNEENDLLLLTARLLNLNRQPGSCMGTDGTPWINGVLQANRLTYKGYFRLPTACIAFRKNNIRFDPNFIGSGYEDTDWMNKLNQAFPSKWMGINNECKLIHLNEQKRQGGKYWLHNKNYYLSMWPDDQTVKNQHDWTGGKINE